MLQTQYPVPPPYHVPEDYRTSPISPAQGAYYSPRQYAYASTPPMRGHTRRATQDPTYTTPYTTYTTPKKTNYYSGAEYSSPAYYSSEKPRSQKRQPDYVSPSDRKNGDARYRARESTYAHKHSTPKSYHVRREDEYVYDDGYEYEYLPSYERYATRPPPYERAQTYHHHHREPRADHYRGDQVPIYTTADTSAKTERPRRSSHTTKPTYTTTYTTYETPRRPTTASKPKPPPKATATEEDARRAGIPAGYSYKNWDPLEEPILLLGSVFDANSLGKWIYDWTVFFYGPATPMSEIAGELWLLLIQLAGKMKRAEEVLPRIRQTKCRELVDDFLESGERLWQRFNKLLKICENFMWKAAKKESGDAKKVTMGKNAGCEFVDAIFGRDRELERTEKLMTGIRLWSLRYAANIDPILADPAA